MEEVGFVAAAGGRGVVWICCSCGRPVLRNVEGWPRKIRAGRGRAANDMNPMHTPEHPRHLSRLSRIWIANPKYFITLCAEQRREILATKPVAAVLREEWQNALGHHGWAVGTYCIMPDHVHFFCTDGERGIPLSGFIGKWKEWTAKRLKRSVGLDGTIWQKGFFDHLLRSDESYSEKWEYVRNNPVRAGLVEKAETWPFLGHIHYL